MSWAHLLTSILQVEYLNADFRSQLPPDVEPDSDMSDMEDRVWWIGDISFLPICFACCVACYRRFVLSHHLRLASPSG